MLNEHLFSSKSFDWETPQDFYDKLDREFHFTLDVCATKENAKCREYFTPEQDGLKQEWYGTCWMNPPYGKGIDRWMKKAVEAYKRGVEVVCLIPARTDTKWWHEWVMPYASEIRFIRGRLYFGGQEKPTPFPSVVVVYKGGQVPVLGVIDR